MIPRRLCVPTFALSLVALTVAADAPRSPELWLGSERLLTATVARTQAARAQGLSGKPNLAQDRGMLFEYREPHRGALYMWRVNFPLTAVFLVKGRVVETLDMQPCTQRLAARCPRYIPARAFDAVLEGNPERLRRVTPGMRIQHRYP